MKILKYVATSKDTSQDVKNFVFDISNINARSVEQKSPNITDFSIENTKIDIYAKQLKPGSVENPGIQSHALKLPPKNTSLNVYSEAVAVAAISKSAITSKQMKKTSFSSFKVLETLIATTGDCAVVRDLLSSQMQGK